MIVASHPMPPGRRALTTVVVMAATIMVILDATVANVALPHKQSALGATQDSVSWMLTGYILALAVATPVTGWLSERYGRRAIRRRGRRLHGQLRFLWARHLAADNGRGAGAAGHIRRVPRAAQPGGDGRH